MNGSNQIANKIELGRNIKFEILQQFPNQMPFENIEFLSMYGKCNFITRLELK